MISRGERSKPNAIEASLGQLGGLAKGECFKPPPAGMLGIRAPLTKTFGFLRPID